MLLRKPALLVVALFSITFSVFVQAQEELVYVLWSLNSRAEMYLIQRLDNNKPKVLASIKRDMTIDEAYLDHVGNIAFKRTRTAMSAGNYDPTGKAVAVARKMSQEMLNEQKAVLAQKGIDPAKIPSSFLYAVAGFDATTAKEGDELFAYFNPQDVIEIQNEAEKAIKDTFQSSGITLTGIWTTRDTALIGEAMKRMNAEDELFVFKTTYDLVCSMEQGTLKTVDMKMPYGENKKLPSGSTHSIGAFASDNFFVNARSPECLFSDPACQTEIAEWSIESDARTYLHQHINPNATDEAFFQRYSERKRKNELGHRVLLLRLQDADAPTALKEWYADHMKATMQPTLDEIKKNASALIARAAEKGKTNPPHVYFLGEYAEINEIDFVNALFRKHFQEWGLTYSYINKQATDLLMAAGALVIISSFNQATP
ncbi:hypothetical protein [Endozoicomonas arenosclerae]|uniref:hypothetical protein n=1 Tax=Endozoicomonas arenosclerae TaxID=1633495 RepID=UPI000786436D|nr:hypothetical protein [Endozoicomonas arenosclerae]